MADGTDVMVTIPQGTLRRGFLYNLRRVLEVARTSGQRYDLETAADAAIQAIQRTEPTTWGASTWKYAAYFTSTWARDVPAEFDLAAAAYPQFEACRRDAARCVYYGLRLDRRPDSLPKLVRTLARIVDVEYIIAAVDVELENYRRGVPMYRPSDVAIDVDRSRVLLELRAVLLWPLVYMRAMVNDGRARHEGALDGTLGWLMTTAPLWVFIAVLRP